MDMISLPIVDPVPQEPKLDLSLIKAKLADAKGDRYWKSLEEVAETPEFKAYLENEFPSKHELWEDPISRRDFLKIMGASFAMAFFSGCKKPLQKIFPYQENPEDMVVGKPLSFATTLDFGGYGRGALVTSHEGRPTKVEGNPQHPASLGGTDIFMQAAILSMYDPDRSQTVINRGITSSWESFGREVRALLDAQAVSQGAGVRLLTGDITSPTLLHQIDLFRKKFPKAQWITYEPTGQDSIREGARMAFGEVVEPVYHIDKADVIVDLDADFLTVGSGHLRYAREFARRRKPDNKSGMNRLYVVEPIPTATGSSADHRLALKSADIALFAAALASELGLPTASTEGTLEPQARKWAATVARDLNRHGNSALVLVGASQPPAVHALGHAINHVLGSIGRTVTYVTPAQPQPKAQIDSLGDLVADMNAGKVQLLMMLETNPVLTVPADLAFVQALDKVGTRVHFGLYEDETSMHCHWHIPQAHTLESWGDLRAYDGTISLVQPLIAPLYEGKTATEVMSILLDDLPQNSHDLLKSFWKSNVKVLDFERFWKTTLNEGIVAESALPQKSLSLRNRSDSFKPLAGADSNALEIVYKPDPSVWDGRYANNGWLQELPKPVSKLTWDNAACISPNTAQYLGVENENVMDLQIGDRHISGAPVWIVPGQADGTVVVHLGYGRTKAGHVGNDRGFNVYTLRTREAMSAQSGLTAQHRWGHYQLATTQDHGTMEGRDLVREGTFSEYQRNPEFAQTKEKDPAWDDSLYHGPQADDYAWAMTIDLNACIGCNACVLGCQSENNIPVVGKDQVFKGREMQWIRIDRYFKGDLETPEVAFQPVTCMHCENAPCEPVCPVGATVHSDEGLNEMVYNRCIGTRYCSNNCPYKVRRFNFLQYTDEKTEQYKMMRNPDVTARMRGVMEKCTYCIQRINAAKFTADKEDRLVKEGEIVTACQSACPTEAITFGNLKEKGSAVSALRTDPRSYGLLTELGTRPRTTYLARLRNPNPELV